MTSRIKKPKAKVKLSLWSETIPKLQMCWDSTSLRDFETCPYLYKLHMIDGWVPKKRPPSLHFGIAYHKGLEAYEKQKVLGSDFNEAVRTGLRAALLEWGDYQSDDNRRTQFTLARSLIWYADKYLIDAAETLVLPTGRPAVELSFRSPLPFFSVDHQQFIACGHLDRIVHYAGGIRVSDAKTTVTTLSQRYFDMYDLDVQMDLYDFFGRVTLEKEIDGILLDVAQVAVNFTRFQRGFSNRTDEQRDEWMSDLEFWIKQAEDCAIKEEWPQNKTSCSKFGGCRYREVCAKSPSVRKVVLEADFKVDHWNPLENRGD
jgi:hypothetical protein